MREITIEIPDQLAERLSPYREQLPQILELGLAGLETASPHPDDWRERTIRVLMETGLVRTPETSLRPRRRHTPIKMAGKPLSELIIEQRGRL
ncbi:MAG: hypothetical protein FJ009_09415 [Chloroflexi bacterium]|nr:hypothetical protein [Chloroflexota bacterium]